MKINFGDYLVGPTQPPYGLCGLQSRLQSFTVDDLLFIILSLTIFSFCFSSTQRLRASRSRGQHRPSLGLHTHRSLHRALTLVKWVKSHCCCTSRGKLDTSWLYSSDVLSPLAPPRTIKQRREPTQVDRCVACSTTRLRTHAGSRGCAPLMQSHGWSLSQANPMSLRLHPE